VENINGKIEPVMALDQKSDSPLRVAFTERVLHRTMSEAGRTAPGDLRRPQLPTAGEQRGGALTTVRTIIGGIAYVSANADLKGVKVVSIE